MPVVIVFTSPRKKFHTRFSIIKQLYISIAPQPSETFLLYPLELRARYQQKPYPWSLCCTETWFSTQDTISAAISSGSFLSSYSSFAY